jgi:hypothetical protein
MKPESDPTAIEDDGTPSRILPSSFSGEELRRNKDLLNVHRKDKY